MKELNTTYKIEFKKKKSLALDPPTVFRKYRRQINDFRDTSGMQKKKNSHCRKLQDE